MPRLQHQPHPKRLRSVRTAKEKAKKQAIQATKRSYFDGVHALPVELIAHILSYVPSPRDVLSLARCNKHLCATLLNANQKYIWKRAREECILGPVVGPPPGWSEAAHAAFMFDGGYCEVCGNFAARRYTSFALKVRLCVNTKCQFKFAGDQLITDPGPVEIRRHLEKWIPCLEESTTFGWGRERVFVCRKSDWEAGVEEYNRSLRTTGGLEYLAEKHAKEGRLMPKMVAHYRELCLFSQRWDARYKSVKSSNDAMAAGIAEEEGWPIRDLMSEPTFRLLHINLTNSLQSYTHKDYDFIRPKVLSEMASLLVRHRTRKQVRSYSTRCNDIERHHQRVKSSGAYGLVPSISEFRKLPPMEAMLERDTESINEELKRSDLIAGLLKDSVVKWRENAKNGLAKLLGIDEWKFVSLKVLHPAERVTARFLCKACGDKATSLDFTGVCKHECPGMSAGALKAPWLATERYIPDQTAINVHTHALKLAQVNPEDPNALKKLENLGPCFECGSCDSRISMNFRCLAAHSKRHKNMEIMLLSEEKVRDRLKAPVTLPFQHGAVAKYTANDAHARKLRATERFICRHCTLPKGLVRPGFTVPLLTPTVVAAEPVVISSVSTPPASNTVPAPLLPEQPKSIVHDAGHSEDKPTYPKGSFSYDGMVSHVMSKHGAASVGDEDFFPVANLDML